MNPIDITSVVPQHALIPMQLPALTPSVVRGSKSVSKLHASFPIGLLGMQNSIVGLELADGCSDGWELGSDDDEG